VEGEGTSLTVGVTTGGSNIISGNSDRDPDMVRRCGDPINTCAERIAQPIGILALDGASPVAKGALVTKLTVSKITIQNNATEDGRGGAFWMHNGPANNVTLNSNAIDDNSLGVGVEKTDGATLVDNHFSGNNYGVVLGWGEASNKNIIQSNRIDNGGVAGLLVGQGTGNKISQNYSTGNSGYGIHLLPTAVNNTLYANRAQNNGLVGFLDESLGTLKGGTANIYTSTSNICDGNNGGAGAVQSSPLDICR
jgi:parallel beta-helix repeat protein